MKNVIIYTDGACSGNPGVGGWGALLLYKEVEKTISGSVEYTTNNRMELMAAIEALRALKQPCNVDLYTDSVYVKSGIMIWLPKWIKNGWQTGNKQPVKNQDLWEQLSSLTSKHKINWHWVKGHSDNVYNQLVDKLARDAVVSFKEQQARR